jgi:hypothetical protein
MADKSGALCGRTLGTSYGDTLVSGTRIQERKVDLFFGVFDRALEALPE